MMRMSLSIISIFFLFFIVGCSNEENNYPTERLHSYIEHWNDKNFSEMYNMLTEETIEQYNTEDFVDRYMKIYEDLEITDLQVTFSEISEDELEKSIEEKSATFPINVQMDSLAGKIEFSNEIELTLVTIDEEAEEEEWFINWNTSLIFPDLDDGAIIKIEKESPRRGDILDRNRIPLAINDVAYEIGLVPELIVDEQNEINQVAQLLHMGTDTINDLLNASWVEPHHFVPLKTIPNNADSIISKLNTIPSVQMKETEGRSYPLGEKAAHLTGYIGQITAEELEEMKENHYKETDVIGKRGLEQLYEEQLRGQEGIKIIIEKEDKTQTVLAEKPVQNGDNVQLTIDINVQEKTYEAFDEKSGAASVIHPKTGEILALVSNPSFDPNELTYGITQSKWDNLLTNEEEPLINRFTSTFAPGSVIKPITAAIGLDNGTINHDETVEIKGLQWSKDNWEKFKVTRVSESDQPVDLRDALIRSDNIYFAMKSIEIGNNAFVQGLQNLGFGEALPLTYPFKKSQISNSGSLTADILLANTGYGQGEIEVSPLHIALLYTTFINEGNIVKPSLLLNDKTEEIWLEHVISAEDAAKINGYLREVVTDGTGKTANRKELEISGKTGTAELKLTHDSEDHENGWFIGYPTQKEDILVAMMMEKIEKEGSSIVAETVADLLIELEKLK